MGSLANKPPGTSRGLVHFIFCKLPLAPEPAEAFPVRNAQREAPAVGMVGDAGELAKGGVDVLGPDPNAVLPVTGQRLRVERHVELACVGGAENAIAADAPAQEHDR